MFDLNMLRLFINSLLSLFFCLFPQKSPLFGQILINPINPFTDQACSVKMVGCWLILFLCFLGQYPGTLISRLVDNACLTHIQTLFTKNIANRELQKLTKNNYSLNFNFWFSRLSEVLIISKCDLICGCLSQF